MNTHIFGLALLMFALHTMPLHAQQGSATRQGSASGQGYTLQRCIDIGLTNNNDLRRARNMAEATGSYRSSAYGEFLPSVSASASWSRSDEDQIRLRSDQLIQSRNSYNYGIDAGLTLFNGMRNFSTVDKSIIDFEAAEQSAKRTRELIVYSIEEAFYNALRLRELVAVQEANVERSRKQLTRIREMNAVGSVPLADVYRQEVQVGTDELSLVQARNNYQNMLADVQALIGVEPSTDFTLIDDNAGATVSATDAAAYRGALGDYGALLREAVERRADVRQSELAVRSADKSITIARSGHYPSLTAFAQYGWSNLELRDFETYDRFSYGLSLSVPIFSGFQVSTAVQRSQIQLRDAQDADAQLRRSIATEVRKALNNLESYALNLDIAAKKLLSAKEDQRIAEERYNLGSGTLLDMLTAGANLRLAESDVVNARFSYITAQRLMDYTLGRTSN